MSEPFDVEAVSADVLERVDRLCIEFERAFRAGRVPTIESYLRRLDPEDRPPALYYLIRLQRELLGKQDKEPLLEQYQERFPEYPSVVEAAWDEPSCFQVDLEVLVGPHAGRRFVFRQHDSFIVGRAESAHFQLPLKDPFFSRVHFLVEVNPPCCRLVDLCSLNGTKVNGRQVEWIDLQHGDLIQAGDTVMRVTIKMPVSVPGRTPCPAETAAPPPVCPPEPLEDELPERRGDRRPPIPGYRLLEEIGSGGMGVVFHARRSADGAPVAIKLIRCAYMPGDSEVRRFLREARILCALRHPNIVSFHQFGRADDVFYIVMDFVAGRNATELVSQCGPLAIDRAVRIVCQALEALRYAHQKGYVHRDVKPSNLLISDEGPSEICRLADFGLARAYHATRMSGLTLMGDMGGTLPFMAPEQVADFHGAGPSADQFGAAATLYYLCTRRYIYPDDSCRDRGQLARDILVGRPVPIEQRRADIPSRLGQIIHKALAKNPDDRFASAADLRAALSRYARG